MKTIKTLILSLILAGAMMFAGMAIPGQAYAHCDDALDDCKEECEEVFDGDGWFAETGRSICKGGCHVAKLACELDLI